MKIGVKFFTDVRAYSHCFHCFNFFIKNMTTLYKPLGVFSEVMMPAYIILFAKMCGFILNS